MNMQHLPRESNLCVFGNRSHRCFNRWHRWTALKTKSMGKALHHCGDYCTMNLKVWRKRDSNFGREKGLVVQLILKQIMRN